VDTRRDGRIKLFTIARALAVRQSLADTFGSGAYVPLRATGTHAEQVFAFARTGPSGIAVTCVPRLIGSLPGRCATPPLGRDCWGDTAVMLPCALGATPLANAFTGQELTPTPSPGNGTRLEVGNLFVDFPIALLTGQGPIGDGR
jgi:(1->4)-alpha-D-glucan 1-alpha-D-glucosylmutase